ncbi:peroxiredoxin [Leucobacter luti]|uniref:MerR family transcriptional regulator n=1 Tax=Leucobacter luti TaxID=340320 RepID=UPI001044E923|nr:MerR family transcriptional regulator [Leucobacter luti]MCW2288052.1 peroxiredoxin [Leucobacter luti]TCK45786.1 peroxiredoxin [Leucobacter luti]
MRIGELAQQAGVTVKAVRYYEQIGLVAPKRGNNGYRTYTGQDLRTVREIRELHELGIVPSRAAPFIECLEIGHEHGDECVSSLAVYRDAIAELDRALTELGARRTALQRRLETAAEREVRPAAAPADYTVLPAGLPAPEDDGAAAHLPGKPVPGLILRNSDGESVALDRLGAGRSVIYLYPLTGRPGVDLPEGWDAIPGARGCSTQACDFRDHFQELRAAGVQSVAGLSSQDTDYQAEVAARLALPFPMLSDPDFALAAALQLPTFSAPGHERLYARLTLIIRDGVIEHVFYPIFPPNTHAQQVLDWLAAHPEDDA